MRENRIRIRKLQRLKNVLLLAISALLIALGFLAPFLKKDTTTDTPKPSNAPSFTRVALPPRKFNDYL